MLFRSKAGRDIDALDALQRRLEKEIRAEHASLQAALEGGDPARAGELVRQLMFQEKLLHEIGDALEVLET